MRKLRKNAKALSPVVASIILIAVTVAVSIAVAAWMGALSIGFMETEQMSITNAQFTGDGDTITLSVRNTGTADIQINSATVNGLTASVNSTQTEVTVGKNSDATLVVELPTTDPWEAGNTYQIRVLSAKGNYFPYNAVAP